MKQRFLSTVVAALCAFAFLLTAATAQVSPASFQFTLSAPQSTSAGVFQPDGTLVRTIWSGVSYPAGANTGTWDGLDDWGNLVPAGSYQIRVLANACSYTWEGVVGNTSTASSGPSLWNGYSPIAGMAFSGTTGYAAGGYGEGQSTVGKFSTSAPQSRTLYFNRPFATIGTCTLLLVATDGNLTYFAGVDGYSLSNTFTLAVNVADDSPVTFQSGTNYTLAISPLTINTIDKRTDGSAPTGLAVQRNGSLLFVSHAGTNELTVLNKTTGALVQTITNITAPAALAVDGNDNLWLVRKNGAAYEVGQYSVAANGTLTPTQTISASFDTPMALGVSPDNTMLVVADGGATQQLKAFSVGNGTPSWTFGQPGGYATSVNVTDDRFDFGAYTFVAFQPDGSFWVGDYGNQRSQHYSAARVFIDRVQFRAFSYFCSIDPNNPTRLFSDYLEFSINYSIPLGPNNGSWTLVRNWQKVIPSGYSDQFRNISPVTLSNGRTYTLIGKPDTAEPSRLIRILFEVTADGQLRDTGVHFPKTVDAASLAADGSVWNITYPTSGGTSVGVTWTKYALTGFDPNANPINANPVYANPVPAASSAITDADPINLEFGTVRSAVKTASDVLVAFEPHAPNPSIPTEARYHLGGLRVGGTKWLWRTSMATHRDYGGDWPTDGAFDIGNGVQYAGSLPIAVDHHIFYGYHGEFYKGSQVNKYRHYYDDGLYVGEFGVVGFDVYGVPGAAGMAGNALTPCVVKLPDGRAYLYHGDESVHGGVHRWRVDGLNTITEQTIPLNWTAPTVSGLRGEYFASTVLNNTTLNAIRNDGNINLNWGSDPPAGTANTYSARWNGFVTPLFTETYTFYTNSTNPDGGARLWVNGKLLIDRLSGPGGEYSSTVALVAGQRYAIRVDATRGTGTGSVNLSWSSASQTKQSIPLSAFSWAPWLYPTVSTQTIDLFSDQAFDATVPDATYGISRSPATDVNQFPELWSFGTGEYTYRSALNPKTDVNLVFLSITGNMIRSFTRDLGAPSDSTQQWTLNCDVNFQTYNQGPGSVHANSGTGYQNIEVLDDNGRVIARFNANLLDGSLGTMSVAGNDTEIYRDSGNAAVPMLSSLLAKWQTLKITGSAGNVTFSFGSFAPITTAVYNDPSGTPNWRHPKNLRASFLNRFQNGGNWGAISLRGATFSTTLQSPASVSNISAIGSTLNGILNPNGVPTAVYIEYGTGTGYGQISPMQGLGSGSGTVPFSLALTGLQLNTTYHYRLVSVTNGVTTPYQDQTFTTSSTFTPQVWRQKWYGTTNNTGGAADSADPYHTGVSNLVVFAVLGPNQDPAKAITGLLPQVQRIGGNNVMTFAQPVGVSGVTYGAEWSSDLSAGSWTPIADSGTGTTHTFSVPKGSNPRMFMRLRVSSP